MTPNRISVGERNAIALCYFFSNIMKNKNEDEVYNKQYIIVIDDPISSFDVDNRIGIISYLRKEISRFVSANKKTKILVMSHDLQTSYDIEKIYREVMGNGYREAGSSTYSVGELRNNELMPLNLGKRNEYSFLLENVFLYACGNNDGFDLSVGNAMRRILEAYGTFHYKKGISYLSTIPEITKQLKGLSDHFECLMYRLVLNDESHTKDRVSFIESSNFFSNLSREEKIRTAREVICFLYLLDEYHVRVHLEEIKKINCNNVINSWVKEIADLDGIEYSFDQSQKQILDVPPG